VLRAAGDGATVRRAVLRAACDGATCGAACCGRRCDVRCRVLRAACWTRRTARRTSHAAR